MAAPRGRGTRDPGIDSRGVNTRGDQKSFGGIMGVGENLGVSDGYLNVASSVLDPMGLMRKPEGVMFDATAYQVDPSTGLVQGMGDWMTGQEDLTQSATNINAAQGARIRAMQDAGPAMAQAAGVDAVVPQYGESRKALHEAQNLEARQLQQASGLSDLAGQFGQQAAGEGPMSPEELQLRQQSARNMAAQNAMAAGARGGASGAALYNAANQAANINAQTNATAMQQRAASIQQARQNQMGAIEAAGGLIGEARGQGMTAAGIYSDQEKYGAGIQHTTALEEARNRQAAEMANAAAANRLGEFTESQQGQYDQALFGNLGGIQGQTLEGMGLQEDTWLEGEKLRMDAHEFPAELEADIAIAESEQAADDGAFGAIGGIIGSIF